MFAVLLALGLDDAKGGAVIFHQDQVPEHAELAWYLNTITPVNRLMRMTSWKVRFDSMVREEGGAETEVPDLTIVEQAGDAKERQLGGRD